MKQAVITGGKGSLAQAIAAALEEPGWKILTPSRAEMDVCDKMAIQRYFHSHSADLLICVAGMIYDMPLLRLTETMWDQVLTINFKGAADCARAVIPKMIENHAGHIIFISSFSALHPPVGQVAYATAKATLVGLTQDLSRAYGSFNIRINTILPGFLDTRMTATVSEKRREEILNSHILGRFNTPSAVGKFIYHLHHDLAHTSGQIFQLDSRIT